LLLGSINGGFLVNMLSKLNKLFCVLDVGATLNRYLLNLKSARKSKPFCEAQDSC